MAKFRSNPVGRMIPRPSHPLRSIPPRRLQRRIQPHQIRHPIPPPPQRLVQRPQLALLIPNAAHPRRKTVDLRQRQRLLQIRFVAGGVLTRTQLREVGSVLADAGSVAEGGAGEGEGGGEAGLGAGRVGEGVGGGGGGEGGEGGGGGGGDGGGDGVGVRGA